MAVGDHRKVLEHAQPIGFDPVKGYKQAERNLRDANVREAVREVAQLDGAFIISAAGTGRGSLSVARNGRNRQHHDFERLGNATLGRVLRFQRRPKLLQLSLANRTVLCGSFKMAKSS